MNTMPHHSVLLRKILAPCEKLTEKGYAAASACVPAQNWVGDPSTGENK